MSIDFFKYHHIPRPDHIDDWVELEYVRIIRFKGDVNSATLPRILEFKVELDKAGLPEKNLILDGKMISSVDSATVATILIELQHEGQKVALINVPQELLAYLDLFHQGNSKLAIFASESDAIAALNQHNSGSRYLPAVRRTLKKNKALSLLLALLMFLIALPFFEADMMGIIYLVFFTFVLLSGIYAVSYNMRHVAAGVLLATPTLVTGWSGIFLKDPMIKNAEMVFLTIFLVYTLAVILRHVLAVKHVTINELYGAICVYIMVGMTFGVIYALLLSLDPNSLALPPGEVDPRMTGFFYFSFVTMSSTGFSGFTAVSPLARSLVIVQVIIGVMYVAALIGKLVGANTGKEDVLPELIERKLKTDFWDQSLAENFFRRRPALLILSMAMLNYSSSVLMTVLNLPFFLDSWGTSLAVVLGGLPAGLAAGVLYNLAMAWTFWGPSSWVWMFCNILIALLTWAYLKWGWIDLHKPVRLLGAGLITGVLNSVAVGIITALSGIPMYQGIMAVYRFFVELTGNHALASVAEKLTVEIADKSISLLLVAVAVIYIRDIFHWNKSKEDVRP